MKGVAEASSQFVGAVEFATPRPERWAGNARYSGALIQTEFGEVPADWRVGALAQVCEFENGDRGTGYPSKSEFRAEGVPFINAGHVNAGDVHHRSLDFISKAKRDSLRSGKYRVGDILFCLRGSLGKFGVVEPRHAGGAIASSLIIVRPKHGLTSLGYLRQYFSSKLCFDMIDLWAGGAAQPNLGGAQLSKFLIPLPPLREQEAIAEALSDADGAVRAVERLIEKKRAIRQAALHALLTPTIRLPGFADDWKQEALGALGTIKAGTGITGPNIEETGSYKCYGGNGLRGYTERWTHEGAYVLIGRVGALCGNIQLTDGRFFASEHALVFEHTDRICPRWLSYLLRQLELGRLSEASAQPVLTSGKLKQVHVLVPTLREQHAVGDILSDMDTEITALEARRGKLRAIKQGMMQSLLTGKVRLV